GGTPGFRRVRLYSSWSMSFSKGKSIMTELPGPLVVTLMGSILFSFSLNRLKPLIQKPFAIVPKFQKVDTRKRQNAVEHSKAESHRGERICICDVDCPKSNRASGVRACQHEMYGCVRFLVHRSRCRPRTYA